MSIFSDLFSSKKDEHISEKTEEIDVLVDEIDIFTPYKKLIEISKTLVKIDEDISVTLNNFAYNSELLNDDLLKITSKLENMITSSSVELSKLTDPGHIFSNIKKSCSDISKFNFNKNCLTYTDFLQRNDFLYLSLQNEILVKLKENSLKIDDFSELHGKISTILEKYDALTKKSTALSLENDSLTTEIINFTNTVNSIKSKNRLSVDWNGKKPTMMNLGKQLNIKRSSFIDSENELNIKISELYDIYYISHNMFKLHCAEIVSIFQENTNLLTSNYENKIKNSSMTIKKLKLSKKMLDEFILEFNA